ncbi:hypothetical protein QNM99_11425 [Pseudomonas sp. PCH446]
MLLLPLLIYTAVFFVLPIGMILYRAVSNPEMVHAFPRTVQALEQAKRGDTLSVPGDSVFDALEQDLTHVENLGVIGEAARRMNYENSGYRFLITATARRYQWPANQQPVSGDSARARLATIDPRWATPSYGMRSNARRRRIPLTTYSAPWTCSTRPRASSG